MDKSSCVSFPPSPDRRARPSLESDVRAVNRLLDSAAASLGSPGHAKLVDLTHPFDATTIHWPTATPFALEHVLRGRTEDAHWYAANRFCAAEHGGTHLDAPLHFAEGGAAADAVPLERLPATGASVVALPMKITGGPLRRIAVVPAAR